MAGVGREALFAPKLAFLEFKLRAALTPGCVSVPASVLSRKYIAEFARSATSMLRCSSSP